jgi:hypothetical protein
LKAAQASPEALEECREATWDFARSVADLLGVDVRLRDNIVDRDTA